MFVGQEKRTGLAERNYEERSGAGVFRGCYYANLHAYFLPIVMAVTVLGDLKGATLDVSKTKR